MHSPPPPRVSCLGTLGEGRRAAGGRRCKSTLTLARALRRPPRGVFLHQGSSEPLLLLRGCTREGLSLPWWSDRSLPKWAQLCKPRLNSQRLGKEPLPATVRFPSPHPQTQSTSFLPEAAATRAWPPPRCPRTSSSQRRGAEPAANGVAAAQYRGAAHTITAPQDRRRARPGVGCARQLRALEARRTSPAPRRPRSAASAPPRSRAHSPAPSPNPLHPGPAALPAQEAPRESPSSNPTAPLTAAQRPAAEQEEGAAAEGPGPVR